MQENVQIRVKKFALMFRYQSQNQLTIKEFEMPFEAELNPTNRWVLMSQMIPWDEFARAYQKNFPSRRGAPTIDATVADADIKFPTDLAKDLSPKCEESLSEFVEEEA